MNISVLESSDNVYISDSVKIPFSAHGLEKIYLIAIVRIGQRCNKSSSNIHDSLLTKIVSNVNLKTLAILTKRIILDVRLSPGYASSD